MADKSTHWPMHNRTVQGFYTLLMWRALPLPDVKKHALPYLVKLLVNQECYHGDRDKVSDCKCVIYYFIRCSDR